MSSPHHAEHPSTPFQSVKTRIRGGRFQGAGQGYIDETNGAKLTEENTTSSDRVPLPEAVIIEAIGASMEALSAIQVTELDLAEADRVIESASAHKDGVLAGVYDCGTVVSPAVGIILTGKALWTWLNNDLSSLQALGSWWPWFDLPPDNPDSDLLDLIMKGSSSLLRLAQSKGVLSDAESACQSFYLLAKSLVAREEPSRAQACAVSASNLSIGIQNSLALDACELALGLFQGTEKYHITSRLWNRRATLLVSFATTDASRQLEAFDAMETALRHLPGDGALREEVIESLIPHLQDEYLHPLLALALLSSESHRRKVPQIPQELCLNADPLVDVSQDEFNASMVEVMPYVIAIDNARARLEPRRDDPVAEASWITWSFDHSAFRRAIPHSKSLLRESDMHQLLLVLGHETTHVYTMFSGLAYSMLALRGALLETETRLWSYILPKAELEQALKAGVAPLEDHTVLALGQAEQAIEIARKMQILQGVWTPWFEGVAVFGEVSADPHDDSSTYSPIVRIISNLVDVSPWEEAKVSDIPVDEALRRLQRESDDRYSTAVRELGRLRLRTYLVRDRRKYLAGYLAVRAVVSRWRLTTGRPISGAQAFRALLWITRCGTVEAVPNLALSAVEFERQALQAMADWIQTIGSLPDSDIQTALDDGVSFALEGQRLVHASEEALRIRQEQALRERYREAVNSMVGDFADVDRVGNEERDGLDRESDEAALCRMIMKTLATSLATAGSDPNEMISTFFHRVLGRHEILPIGQCKALFWVNRSTRAIFCVVRTTEKGESGNPGYDGFLYVLPKAEFQALEQELSSCPDRRILVTRVADCGENCGPNRVPGMNYIVLRFGNWMHVQTAGQLIGKRTVAPRLIDSALSRFMRQPLDDFEEAIVGDGGRRGALRTATWIESANGWLVGDRTENLTPWANRVRALCEEVSRPGILREEISANALLLEWVLGDRSSGERLYSRGFDQIEDEGLDVSAIIGALHETSLNPMASSLLDSSHEALERCIGELFHRTNLGWDVRPLTANLGGHR